MDGGPHLNVVLNFDQVVVNGPVSGGDYTPL